MFDCIRCSMFANTAHIRQYRPDSGLGFQVTVRTPFNVFLFARKRTLELITRGGADVQDSQDAVTWHIKTVKATCFGT